MHEEDVLAQMEARIRQGDWNAVLELSGKVVQDRIIPTEEGLRERLRRLQGVLVAARVARSGLAASWVRLNAAASFARSRTVPERQGYGEPTNY